MGAALAGAVVMSGVVWDIATAAPARAADATGCSGSATSFDRNGVQMGSASAPGIGATSDNPLRVDAQGTLNYQGQTDQVLQDGSWNVQIYNLTSLSGHITNSSGQTSTQGVADLSNYLHISFGFFDASITGKFHAKFVASSAAGSCTVDGYIYIVDSPVKTPAFYLAGLLILVALLIFLLFGRPEPLIDAMTGDFSTVIDEMAPGP